ncbi:MAG: glycosyltransferase [Pseudomonadota bacterium]
MQMTDMPLVSVVTVYYNREAYVDEAIESLLAQTYPHLEIIAVDDGSTDGTLKALKRFDDPRYRVVSKPNSGFTDAVNVGIQASLGALVAIHGSGDISYPDRIAQQAALMQARSEVGLVGCHVAIEQSVGAPHKIRARQKHAPLKDTISRSNPFTHGEVMFRRALYDRVGGYRPFFQYAQDRDLWVRMARYADYDIVPETLYTRRKLADGVAVNPTKLLMQAYFSDFAIQCGDSVDMHGRDLLDKHGPKAAFLRKPSKALSKKLSGYAMQWMHRGEPDAANMLMEAALKEGRLPSTLLKHALCHLYQWPSVWRLCVTPVLERYNMLRPHL